MYPSQGTPTWGTPQLGEDRGYPSQGMPAHGTPLGQVRMGGGVPQPGGHLPGVPPQPGEDRGVPQPEGAPPPPGTGQHMEYLISGGRYASCVHAGGLSCFYCMEIDEIGLLMKRSSSTVPGWPHSIGDEIPCVFTQKFPCL